MTTRGSKTKLLLLAAIAVVVIATGYFYSREGPSNPESQVSTSTSENPSNTYVRPKAIDEVQEWGQSGATTPVPSAAEPQGQADSPMPQPAWRISHDDSPSMPLPEGIVDYEPVAVDMESPAYPQPGQQVSLGLPGGEIVNATVKTGNENPNGDYSWRGYLDGYGTDYPVVMTYGANSVFATITTPKGSYTLESLNGSGWVYKNPAEFELSDPGKNDYLEPDQPHGHK